MSDDSTFWMFLIAPPLAGELILLVLIHHYTKAGAKSAPWPRVVAVNLLSCLVILGLTFAGGELYYRYIYDTTDSLAYTKVSQRWVERYCIYNSAGFRDNIEYLLAPEAGKRRVSFLGDSFTAGHGIKSVEDRFPNLIRARHPEWEVHALAAFGRDTGAEMDMLMDARKRGYVLDQVVLVYCLNDVADLFPDWKTAVTKLFNDVDHGGWLRRHSFFFDILYHRYKAAHDPILSKYYSFVREGYQGRLWEIQQKRLRALRDYVQANGGRLSVVTFPFLQSLGDSYEYRSVHQELDRLWRELGVPHLDLLGVYSNLPPERLTVSRYDAHPNEYANLLAAEKIEQFLAGQLSSSPRPGSMTNR